MLRALDPNATFTYEPKGQEELPPNHRLRLVCRYLTMRQHLAIRDKRIETLRLTEDDKWASACLDMLRTMVVRVEGHPDGREDIDGLLDVATPYQLWDWIAWISRQQDLTERDLGNFVSPQPGAAAPCASSAEGDSA